MGIATDIAHPVGFLAGSVVYVLLLFMVLQGTGRVSLATGMAARPWPERMRLPLYMAVLGLIWNGASLAAVLAAEFRGIAEPPILLYLATSALGCLPAVAMHSVWQTSAAEVRRPVGVLTVAGYGLSAVAAGWHGAVMIAGDPIPDTGPWGLMTAGFVGLFFGLLMAAKRTLAGHGGLVVVFLALCSVVALPLSHHPDDSLPWWLDFLGHHASLPVAVAVLYRDYRFAFVDRFIKRTLSFLLLVGMSFGLYVGAVLPQLKAGGAGGVSPALSGMVIVLWVVTALAYPWLHRQVTWVFDALLLHRPDYQDLRRQLVQHLERHETAAAVLEELCRSLQPALRAPAVRCEQIADIPSLPRLLDLRGEPDSPVSSGRADCAGPVSMAAGGVSNVIPTLEAPRWRLVIAARADGHRFLSEELMLIEAASLIAARRIDTLRTSHERCELALREQEMQKLTTEAELRALRAQVNPHFLFNALNTIGYLIDTAPERAAGTLRDLTHLLRGILRRMDGSFTTLGEEIDLIRSYLDIEQARFEERLFVQVDVPEELYRLQVPALVLQPLVENAVKHGIQPAVNGGEIRLVAKRVPAFPRHGGAVPAAELLSVEIRDTGAGATAEALRSGRRDGIGLGNVENRLRCHYGARASLQIVSEPGIGTTVEVRFPADDVSGPVVRPVVSAATGGER